MPLKEDSIHTISDRNYFDMKEIKEAIVNGLVANSLTPIRDAVSHLTRLDDFNVTKLSAGFFSEVFKVTHISTHKVMVLKMNKHAGNRGNALKEIELLNKLNHPNVVAFMGTVVHEGQLHPLLEYLNGGTLENLIKRFYDASVVKRLAASESSPSNKKCYELCISQSTVPVSEDNQKISLLFCKLAKDIAQGMKYVHELNYIHRDLTSKNVLLRRNVDALTTTCDPQELTAVIADFGFAANEPSPNDPKLPTVGSPYWMAPECLKCQWYNHKCDIFSFGVICCELNWRIPADPDFLPRDNNFTILFNNLPASKTSLSKIAQLSTN
ncbi:dual specificity protein kinase shkD-like isoform X2, partial [Dinothrombium tinctorium]